MAKTKKDSCSKLKSKIKAHMSRDMKDFKKEYNEDKQFIKSLKTANKKSK